MYILSDLYNGQINPSCRRIRHGSEYETISRQQVELEQTFYQALPPEQKKIYNDLESLQLQLWAISEEDCFIRGFHTGARIILDVVSAYRSQLPQMDDE